MIDNIAENTSRYLVNQSDSRIEWIGFKLNQEHRGIIPIAEGELITSSQRIIGGVFTLDISNIRNTDITDPDKRAEFEDFLKSKQFLAVQDYSTANFEITDITPAGDPGEYQVQGNLTLKEITDTVIFTAQTNFSPSVDPAIEPDPELDQIILEAEFLLDLTTWEIDLKDETIDDEVTIKIYLVAECCLV